VGQIGLFNEHGTYNPEHFYISKLDLTCDERRFYGKVVDETDRLIWVVNFHENPVNAKYCYSKDYFELGIINWVPVAEHNVPENKPSYDELQINMEQDASPIEGYPNLLCASLG
jgi:hypothetical protein